jgi:hypothetical protein
MPVRDRLAGELWEQFTGVHVWDGRVGECKTMPTDDYYAARAAADALFVFLIDRIDWKRVFLDAMGRHGSLIDADIHPKTRDDWMFPRACPDCVREALLTRDRLAEGWVTDGKATPAAPTEGPHDFAAALAAAVAFRQQNR